MATFKQYIKKDGTKAWQFQAYLGVDPVTGKKKKTTKRGFKTKKEAELSASRLQLEIDEKGFKSDYNITTYKELYELWFEQHSKGIKATTKQRITFIFDKSILPEIGHMKLQKITPAICQKAVNKWSEKYVAYDKMKGYASKIFKYGILLDIVRDNPFERILMPKRKENYEKEELDLFYTREELEYFFQCLKELKDTRSYTFFRILAFTGARKGEVLALTWEDIDLENGTISFNKTLAELRGGSPVIQTPKTKASFRTVSIDPVTVEVLRKWRNMQNEKKMRFGLTGDQTHNVVICNSILYNKQKYLYSSYPKNVMDKVCRYFPNVKRIKIHGFRHTHASLCFESGAEPKVVQKRLGHSSIKTTLDIYTHVTPKAEEDAGLKFAKYVNF